MAIEDPFEIRFEISERAKTTPAVSKEFHQLTMTDWDFMRNPSRAFLLRKYLADNGVPTEFDTGSSSQIVILNLVGKEQFEKVDRLIGEWLNCDDMRTHDE